MSVMQTVRAVAMSVVLLSALAPLLSAQQPAANAPQPSPARQPEQAALAADAEYVPRQPKFTRSEEPYPITLAARRPSYAVQPWKVAVLHLEGLVMPGPQSGERMKQIPLSQAHLDSFIQATDKSLLPSADVVTFFRQAGEQGDPPAFGRHLRPSYVFYRRLDRPLEVDQRQDPRQIMERRMMEQRIGDVEYERGEFELVILAPPEKIEEISRALLMLLNQSVALPARKHVVGVLNSAAEKLKESEAAVEQARQKRDQLEIVWQEVSGVEPIAKETVMELKTKRALLSVERAGIVARIQAAEKMADAKQPHLLAAKADSEIDLAGITGQMKEIDRLVSDADRWMRANKNASGASSNLQRAERQLESSQRAVTFHTENFEATAPYKLIDDTIMIHPIPSAEAKE